MRPNVTRPQLAAVAMTTTLLLLGGMTLPALFVNMRLSARDVGGTIMPPGMIMGRDTPKEAMREMSAVHPKHVQHTAGAAARGDTPLEPTRVVKVGETIKLRFIGTNNNFIHPMHVHGGPSPSSRATATRSLKARASRRTRSMSVPASATT
jgi:hypothetical protein